MRKQLPSYTGSVQRKQKPTKNYINLRNLKQRVWQDHSKQNTTQKQSSIQIKTE